MAQALFDEHPLGEYLRDNGEIPLLIPGTYPASGQELIDFNTGFDENSNGYHKEWPPQVLLDFIEFLQTIISSAQADTPSRFVEKFKYNVISSSLLSPALPVPYSRRSSRYLSVPGKLHSRASSMDLDHGISITPIPPSEPFYGLISLSTASVAILFSIGYPLLASIALIVTLLLVYNFFSTTDSHQSDITMTASFNALDDLIEANQIWESVVQNAISMLESDERNLLRSPPTSPLSPSHVRVALYSFPLHTPPTPPSLTPSHVRVALHSCLQTTHTQCDNIRNIFSALTSPAELSQLSEMYAPKVALNVSSTSTTSRFTTPQPTRHPLSLSDLNYALQSTIAAKRYTCSHLLALRFSEEEDEGYWEDVRSIMSLLISTLVDASSRLSEALDEAEHQRLRDQIPTPSLLPSFEDETTFSDQQTYSPSYKSLRTDGRISFAPVPNHISRFTAHVAGISSALNDARDNLEQCISALKEDSSSSSNISGSPQRSRRHSRKPKAAESAPEDAEPEVPAALQAYERLRRELGLALRECERGRSRLLEIVNPPIPNDEEEFDDLPGLGHDLSDDSDKTDPIPPALEDESDLAALVNAGKVSTIMDGGDGGDGGLLLDDATHHLLLTATTKHLPMPGIEEVFEADMGTKAVFTRERSKLTREERIKAAKARRDEGLGLGVAFNSGGGGDSDNEPQKMRGIEKWGPSGEVVQELKDVIWKVSERRRKMADVSKTPKFFDSS